MQPVDVDDGSTSSTLLREVADWENHPAWVRFRDTYDPYLMRWCRGYGLDADAVDEICERIWIELAERMKRFEYDPTGSFRGWLRRVCQSRVLNFLYQRRAHPVLTLDDRDDGPAAGRRGAAGQIIEIDEGEAQGTSDPSRRFLLEQGAKIQAAVRARFKPHNWEAFWLVAVYDWGVEQTAQALGMKKAAVYAAVKRVRAMLRDEGQRVSEEWASGA